MSRVTGTFEKLTIGDERVRAFVPAPLPPKGPALELDRRATELLGRAEEGLRRLDGARGMVPGLEWLDAALARKEAIASAQLAGSHATLAVLFAQETRAAAARDGSPGRAVARDAAEATNVFDALAQCADELSRPSSGPQISMRLLNRMHQRLLRGLEGQDRAPGRLRDVPTWMGAARAGNATYVPPPPYELRPLLEQLEEYVHRGSHHAALVRIGLIHAQFASIRPYLDGNGRLGRVLVALLLQHWRLLRAPVLPLSVFFERHRADTQRLLAGVRSEGDWESWIAFFLEAVATMAEEGAETARSLLAQVANDRELVLKSEQASVAGLRLLTHLSSHPIVTVPLVVKLLDTTPPTAAKAVSLLESLGLLRENSGHDRARSFSYERYLELLSSGVE